MIGYSDMYGVYRYTMGSNYLWDGVPLVPFVVGIFAVSELIHYCSRGGSTVRTEAAVEEVRWIRQTVQGIVDVLARPAVTLRSCLLGAGIGVIPGLGGGVAAFLSYVVGMQRSRRSEDFGKGSVEGIISSEVANDAKDGGALLPTVVFGIPGSPDTAILLGAFILHGLQPAPRLLRDHMDLVYALLFGIALSQIFVSGLGIVTAPLLARVSVLPSRRVAPFVVVLVFVGTYMVRSSIWDVALSVLAGVFGYLMRRTGFPLITVAIGYILGPIAERSFLQSLMISDGRYSVFLQGPISVLLILLTVATLLFPFFSARRTRELA
jgi:putative tricarboxylic transport membrane protein